MAKSNMDQDILKVLLSEEEIKARVQALGDQLYDAFKDKNPMFVGVLNGCFIFMADLVRAAQLKSEVEFIGLSSYKNATKSSGVVQITRDLQRDISGRDIIVVEDILDSIDTEHIRLLRLIDCVDTVNEEHVEGMKEERGHEHEEEEEHEHEHGEEEHETHETLTPDEHVWTSPKNAIAIVEQIADVLGELDPEQTAVYEENEKAYVSLLEELDDEFREVVSSAKRDVLLFGDRFPFRYFADEYGLKYYAAFPGCASDTEPSAATMAFLINKAKEEQIPVILKMELSNENIANAIAETTHAKVKTFYSCHNLTAKEFADGETYLSMMKKNVETLKEALN